MNKLTQIDGRYENRPNSEGLRYGIIEVTTKCQLLCPGCYMTRRGALNKGEMTLSQAVRVLDLCREYRGKDLETMDILGGEPLKWPYLQEYVEILLQRNILPWIFTNMLDITPKMAKWLFERSVHVTGKLNINPENTALLPLQAEMIGRSEAVASRMIKAISVFQKAGYKDPLFRVQNLVRKGNVAEVPEYYSWCLKNNIGTDLELMGSGETVGEQYWQVAPTPQEIAEMIRQIQKVRADFGLNPAEVLMPHVFGSCPFFDKGLYFAVNDSIRSCSNSTVNLSNVKEVGCIKKAYESDLICNRLRLTKDLVGEPCHSCDKWEKCRGGCRATVEGLGDCFGGYPLCPVPYL
ncbi:MAG: radical SAM protein [Candidatus Doudnabacteria bacterium]